MKPPKVHCKRCGLTTRRPVSESWEDAGVCPKCYLTKQYKFKAIALGSIKRVNTVKADPVEDYWNWTTRQWLRTNTI